MTPQDLATDAERRKGMDAAFRRASERAEKSPDGMRETARELRRCASSRRDSCDRDAMLRLAAEYERRATDAERQRRPLRATAIAWHTREDPKPETR
ncbi:MAG TPA: hypothetical protein VGL83_03165 [Stellaceae bacterium]|jgi:hypothetical protein